MTLLLSQIEAIAPDPSSVKAAAKLMKPGKWPLRAREPGGALIWGECQGSGANPYRVTADTGDLGAKCTCPSRKFPCKHAIALMWMYADGPADFTDGAVPDWVTDWLARRRKTGAAPAAPKAGARIAPPPGHDDPAPDDPKAEERRKAAAERRAAATRKGVHAATIELERWIADQLRGGLPAFLGDAAARCRRIAARMVDAKAQTLAGRIDELPSRLAVLDPEERIDAAITELGALVLLLRAWRQEPDDPELHRAMITPETREQVIGSAGPVVRARWEVLGERISTRRDGLVSHATWLMNTGEGERFALLLDFFPAQSGRRASAFTAGEQFDAALQFYPARTPLRALILERDAAKVDSAAWPDAGGASPLMAFTTRLGHSPWTLSAPLLLPAGRFCIAAGGGAWWRGAEGNGALPLSTMPEPAARGAVLLATAGLWDGHRFDPLAARTDLGWMGFDG